MTLAQLIGANIKRTRRAQKLTQEAVADLMRWSNRSSVAAIECGYNLPELTTLYALATILNCELFDLVPREWAAQRGTHE